MKEFISWDKILSYWFLIWFFVYMLSSASAKENSLARFLYNNTNPIFICLIGFIGYLGMLFLIIMNTRVKPSYILPVLIIAIIKFVPLWILAQQEIRLYENFIFSLLFLFVYLVYLHIQNENVFTLYSKIYQSILKNENQTPFLYYLHKLV